MRLTFTTAGESHGPALVAIVLADALLEKFGGDSMTELLRNLDGYRTELERRVAR